GIRDWSVTGVQTCALPISCGPAQGPRGRNACTDAASSSARLLSPPWLEMVGRALWGGLGRKRSIRPAPSPSSTRFLRAGLPMWGSEERRVGEEGTARWGAD